MEANISGLSGARVSCAGRRDSAEELSQLIYKGRGGQQSDMELYFSLHDIIPRVDCPFGALEV